MRDLAVTSVLLLALGPVGCGRSLPHSGSDVAPSAHTPERETASARGGRYAAPSWLPCPPGEVTSYMGEAVDYLRRADAVELEIATDWDTVEQVTLRSSGGLESHFRIDGAPFSEDDWSRIEDGPGTLRKPMRVHAWICPDGNTILDWRRR